MRYRRLTGRYTAIMAAEESLSLGDLLRATQSRVLVATPSWRPPADVYETAAALTVTVDLAGVEEEDLEVLLFQDALVISGQRRPQPAEPGVYHAAEIRQGPFRLEVSLPVAVDANAIDARYERGLLHISLTKARRE